MDPDADGPDVVLSDAELTELALAADPDQPVPRDAVPISGAHEGLLPEWYMPAPASTHRTPMRAAVIGVVVFSSIAVNAAGLCVTYGLPEIAW